MAMIANRAVLISETPVHSVDRPVAVEVANLVKTYNGNVHALRDVSFSACKGSILALLGPNGAGKSTTVKILTTLTKPDAGEARVAGINVLREPHRVRLAIGSVAQRIAVDKDSTGRENLQLQAQLYGLRGSPLRRKVAELLDRFSLSDAADRLAGTYSGGMRRKLDIAMGIVHGPQVLFLDEPTIGLDPEARAGLWDHVKLLASEGLTIVLTTHYLEEADQLAEQVVLIDRGRVIASGTPEQLKGELRGDSIEVEVVSPIPKATIEKALTHIGYSDLKCDGRQIHARVDHGASAVPKIVMALEGSGAEMVSVKTARPSLNDVYLHHVGHTFEQSESQGADKQ
jgi:ABC-2 type transport system ATP-binding protein